MRVESLYLPILIIKVGLGCIPASIAKSKGYSAGVYWLYGCVFFLFALVHTCFLPNKNAQKVSLQYNSYTPPVTPKQSPADELKKYKELLDQGVITQAEFDAKKKQILDL